MKKKTVYIAMNSKYFKFREWITKFAFEQDVIPINCLMVYGYYLYDMVPRERIIEAYKTVVLKCDEIWIFGEISDGIREAMIIAKKSNIPRKFFDMTNYPTIVEISEDQAVWEEGVKFG
ncbi:MAG: hypothetical protein Q8N77_01210 [Nanoarchaeota archaeon]|nr:hypothetical protein [Nanoarchaeota archaeon]